MLDLGQVRVEELAALTVGVGMTDELRDAVQLEGRAGDELVPDRMHSLPHDEQVVEVEGQQVQGDRH